MEQVEGSQQPIADDGLRDNGDHVRVIDHILDHFRRRHLSGHQGMVQRARSYHSLSAKFAADVQCHSSHQCQYKLYCDASHDFDTSPGFLFDKLLITDGVVVWRAWVICPDQKRAILMIPVVLLAIDSRAPAFFLSPSVLLELFRSRLPDHGCCEGWLAPYSRGDSYQ